MNNKISSRAIHEAVSVLTTGGVIAFPTETTYGLGCDPRNTEAVERIFRMKGRDHKKPLLLVTGSFEQVERVAFLSTQVRQLAEAYWPGPLTLVLPARVEAELVDGVSVHGEVAVRFSSSELVQSLTNAFGFPIVATSANLTGQPDSRSADDVRAYNLGVDYIIDVGILPKSKPSTVARIKEDGEVEVIRHGAIVIE
jgi:L-threonylcarbamoyladenylate synthase